MIRNRLKELMDVRGLKATRIANDINNLSRNTINSTVSNSGKMIQFETVNLLCQYLGVTPKEFFEYLPFDVLVSVDADNDPIVDTPNYDQNVAPDPNDCFIKPFYLNLYLTKTSNNYSSGESKKTFELSVISDKEILFESSNEFGNNNFIMLTPSFKVVLGNPPIEKNMKSQKEEFFNFWNDDLTDGFKQVIQQKIINSIYDYFSNFQSINNYIEIPSYMPVIFPFDDFNSDYSNLNSGIVMTYKNSILADDELPF